MDEVLKKISSYNLFNYLFPGVMFAFLIENSTNYKLIQENLIVGAFLYYFLGLVISRLGSVVVEPLLKKVKLVKFVEYSDFVRVCKTDDKLEVLSEQNNVYRTLTSLIVFFLLFQAFEFCAEHYSLLREFKITIFLSLLLVLFLASYRKQTDYITTRISVSKEQ